jgi:hypothetical protein
MGDSTKMGLTEFGNMPGNIPILYDLKIDHGVKTAASTHMTIIHSGWDLMRVVTMVVRSVCTDCLIYTICSGSCEDYYNTYWAMVDWLSECEHKVSEKEFEEHLDELF